MIVISRNFPSNADRFDGRRRSFLRLLADLKALNSLMPPRRDFLKLAMAGAISGATSALGVPFAAQAAADSPNAPTPFGPSTVLDLSRALAKKPYEAPKSPLSDPFSSLTYDQYVAIRSKPGSAKP